MTVTEEQLNDILEAFGWSPNAERGPDCIIHAREGVVYWSDAPGQEVALGRVADLSAANRVKVFDAIGGDSAMFYRVGDRA